MANMRTLMPALQRAKSVRLPPDHLLVEEVTLPKQQRDTQIVKDLTVEEIAADIVRWLRQ
jgi:electron transfer flavoprotein beta subunit